MVNERHLKNALEIAIEEVQDLDNISAQDFDDFRERLNGLLDKLKDECEPNLEEDN